MKNYCLFFILLSFSLSCTKASKARHLDVVEVNGNALNAEEFARILSEKMQGMDVVVIKNSNSLEFMKKSIVQEFVESRILKDWATKNQIKLSEEELDAELQKIRKQFPDDISFRQSLAEENLSYDRWFENFKNSQLEKKIVASISKDTVPPSEEEIKKFYNQNLSRFKEAKAYKIRQIVLAKAGDAENLYAQMQKQKNHEGDFAKLAKEYSIGPEGAEGGTLGWVEEGAAPVFDEAAKLSMKVFTKPLQSPFGFHIIQILEKRPARQKSLSEVHQQIYNELLEERKQQVYSDWQKEQIKSAKTKINQEAIDAIVVDIKGS